MLCKPPRLRCLSRQPWGAHTLPTPGTPPRPGPRETLGTSAALNRAEACPDLGSTPGRGERSAACVCWEMPRAAGRQGPEAGGAGCVLWVGAGTARLARGGLRARTGASQELAGANAEATGRQGGGVRLLPQELLGPPLQDSGPPQGSRRAPLTPSASWHRGLVGSLGATVRGRQGSLCLALAAACPPPGRWGEARSGREEKGLWLGPRPQETSGSSGHLSGPASRQTQERLLAGMAARGWAPGCVALGCGPHPPEPVGDGLTPQG